MGGKREPDTRVRKLWRSGSVLEGLESPNPRLLQRDGRTRRNDDAHSSQRPYFSTFEPWHSLLKRPIPGLGLAGTHSLPANAWHYRPMNKVGLEPFANACWSGALIRAEPMHLPTRAERAKERALLRASLPVLQPHVDALRAYGEQHGGAAVAEWEGRIANCEAERDKCLEEKEVLLAEISAVEGRQPPVEDTLQTVQEAARERAAAFEAAALARAQVAELRAEVAALEAMRGGGAAGEALPPEAKEDLEARRASAQAQRQRLGQLLEQFEFEAQRRCLRALGEAAGASVPEPLPDLVGATARQRRPSREDVLSFEKEEGGTET